MGKSFEISIDEPANFNFSFDISNSFNLSAMFVSGKTEGFLFFVAWRT